MLGADSWRVRSVAVEGSGEGAPDAEAELVARAKADRGAFAPLYQRYLGPVYGYCRGCLGSREAAEDATSLVFAKALDGLAGCCEGLFRSWLFAIAHNVVVDARRRARPVVPIAAADDVPDPGRGPEAAAVAAEHDRALRELLGRLPDEQRHVVELRLAGLTGPEIARALGRSHGAVRVAQFRAYNRLRMLLVAEDEEVRDERR